MSNSQLVVQDTEVVIEVTNQDVRVIAVENPNIIVLGTSGPQGIPGETQVVAQVFVQGTPQNTWTINHDLDFVPNITVVDTAGSVVEGDYSYPDENTIIATFIGAFAGKAYLS